MEVSGRRAKGSEEIVNACQMPKEKLCTMDICARHTDEKIIYFCKEHKALACQKCAFLTHRLCKNVSDIKTLSADPRHNQHYKDLTKQIASLESKTDNNRQKRLQNMTTIDTNKKQAKADIKAFCKAMHEHLNKIESTVDEEVDAIGEEDEKKMDTILQECDSVNAELKVVTTDLETNQDPNRKNELFIAIERATVTMETVSNKLTSLSNDNTVREYTFEPADRLKRVMAKVKTLGKLSVSSVANVVSPQSAKTNVKSPNNLDTAIIESDDGINIRTQLDNTKCWITGSTMMEGDTTLAVADWNNTSVKLVDVRQKRVVSQIRLSTYPWDITRIQPDQLAVTLPDTHKVQFLSVTGTSLSLEREMKVSGQCRGIDYNNDRLFISFLAPAQVQILSISGSVLNTINEETDRQIQFNLPYYLTLSVDRSLLYVSDGNYYGYSVYCMDMNGLVKAKYKDQRRTSAYGVSVAEDGSLIVCGGYSHHDVYVISSDCRTGWILTSGEIDHPYSVSYNSALSTLYVGQEYSDTLKVYKLK